MVVVQHLEHVIRKGIHIVTHVRVVRILQAHLVVTEHPVRYLRYAVVVRLQERVIHVLRLLHVHHYLMKQDVRMVQ